MFNFYYVALSLMLCSLMVDTTVGGSVEDEEVAKHQAKYDKAAEKLQGTLKVANRLPEIVKLPLLAVKADPLVRERHQHRNALEAAKLKASEGEPNKVSFKKQASTHVKI